MLHRIACVVLVVAAGCGPAPLGSDAGAADAGEIDADGVDAGAREMDAGVDPDAAPPLDAAAPVDASAIDAPGDAPDDAGDVPMDDTGVCPVAVGTLWGSHAGVDLSALVLVEHFTDICTGQRWAAGFGRAAPSGPIVARLAIDRIILPGASPPPTVIFDVDMAYGAGARVDVTFTRLDETGAAGDFTSLDGTYGGHFELPSCPVRYCL